MLVGYAIVFDIDTDLTVTKVYVEWKYNLWIPIFLHLFMNLFWMLYSVSDNAFGGIYTNIFRNITIAMIIGLTIIFKIRNGIPFEVRKTRYYSKRMNKAD